MSEVTLGQVIWSAVKPIIKIYLIIGTGYFLAKRNILTVETTRNVSDIILTILLPCLVFNKIVTNIEDSDIKNVGIICLSSVLIFGTGGLCGIITKFTSPVPKKWVGGLMAGAIFPNISDIPIAYLQTLDSGLVFTAEEGEKGIAHVCIFLVMFTLCLFNLGGFRLMEHDFKDIIKPHADEENQKSLHEKETNSSENNMREDLANEQAVIDDSDGQINGEDEYEDEEVEDDSIDNDDDFSEESSPARGRKNKILNPVALTSENKLSPKRRNTIDQQQLRTLRNRRVLVNVPELTDQRKTSSNRNSHHRHASINSARSRNTLTRASTNISANSNASASLYSRMMRAPDIRRMPSQNVEDLLNEYSEADRLQGLELSHETRSLRQVLTTDVGILGEDIKNSAPPFMQKYHLSILVFFLKNCLRPCSMSLILSLIIAFIPWFKALFVSTTVYMPNAPDELPPLNFIMDYTSYVGAASVPFALILLGSSIGRLSFGNLKPGFWRAALLLVVLRLCVMPILGVLWVNRLVSAGWIAEDDNMLMFVIMVSWALPSMTTQIYFTAFYTPIDAKERVQMDCASLYLLIQYPLLVISLPFLVTYIVKVQFGK